MEEKKAKLYTTESIESLDPLQFTRLRPQVYAGDCTYSTQLLVEILSNAIDEFNLGHGNEIKICIEGDKVRVRDYGQGFIVNHKREDGKTILEAAFSVLNTSGKYREDGAYEGTSLGSFGIGSKITTFLSHWLAVTTSRDGKHETIHFKEGVFDNRSTGKTDKPTGTCVEWQPSEEFFTHTEVEINKVKELLNTIVCLCPGLTIKLDNNGEKTEYFSKNGLRDYVDREVKDKEIIDNRFCSKFKNGKESIDFILTYTTAYSGTVIPYVNTGLTEKGPHITLIKALITKEFNKFFRDQKWLKEKDENLTGDDIAEGQYIVFNITASGVGYDAQVKSNITKIDMKPFINGLTEDLRAWLESNKKEIKDIADKALNARKAREAAKKAKDAARNNATKGKSKLLNLPTKLTDSWSKKRMECELLIAEGDSAAGGLVGARDGEFQAVFPIRGKSLNLMKAASEKIFANQEVVNIIKALGLELDTKTKKLQYDTSKLRYGRIILCADADPDGQSIKNLLLTCFWTLCPELVTNGHIWVAIPPLFRITTKKNEYIYLRDAAALEEYKRAHVGEKYAVNRNKGLGEQDAQELAECLLNHATRNVEQITVDDVVEANRLFEIFMGPSAGPRKEWILQHSEEANIE